MGTWAQRAEHQEGRPDTVQRELSAGDHCHILLTLALLNNLCCSQLRIQDPCSHGGIICKCQSVRKKADVLFKKEVLLFLLKRKPVG